MKRLLLVFALFLSLIGTSSASHFMGGEIWWECLSNGKYIFHARLYQECFGINYQNTETMLTTVPGIASVAMTLVVINDLSPVCNSNVNFPHIECDNVTGNNQGGIREWVYTSAVYNLPALTPPPEGYVFSIEICNRNPCTNIVNASQYCAFIRAIMYPFNNQTVENCFDNSPFYAEKPFFVGPTGIATSVNHYGFDPDGDSLAFEWVEPWSANNTPLTGYAPGYTYLDPMPGTAQNPNNVPVTVDPYTGAMSFTSFTAGAFVTAIKTSSYRNGIHVADVIREEQLVLLPAGDNLAPDVIPPFPNNLTDPWTDTVSWGDTVSFQMVANDGGLLNDTLTPQSISFTASGLFFGNNYSDTACCCPVPPCATLTPQPPNTSFSTNTVNFTWNTTYLHLLYGNTIMHNFKEYTFSFNYEDDFCPVPARTTKTVRIIIRNPELLAPMLSSYDINSITGQLTIHWVPVEDTNQYFEKYLIYYKNNLSGDFVLLDSVMDITQSSYSPAQPLVPGEFFWAYIQTKTRTNLSGPSNILTNFTTEANIKEPQNQNLSLHYNASTQCLSLQGNIKNLETITVQLFDCLGINHFQKSLQLNSGFNQLEIPVNIKSSGVYFYNITRSALKESGKLLIVK